MQHCSIVETLPIVNVFHNSAHRTQSEINYMHLVDMFLNIACVLCGNIATIAVITVLSKIMTITLVLRASVPDIAVIIQNCGNNLGIMCKHPRYCSNYGIIYDCENNRGAALKCPRYCRTITILSKIGVACKRLSYCGNYNIIQFYYKCTSTLVLRESFAAIVVITTTTCVLRASVPLRYYLGLRQ